MRKIAHILALASAVCFCVGSADPFWLCLRADGSVGIKTTSETQCPPTSLDEAEDDVHDIAVVLPTSDNCCWDIPLGLVGKAQIAKPMRSGKTGSSRLSPHTAALDSQPVPNAAESTSAVPNRPPGLSHLSFARQTVVLLI